MKLILVVRVVQHRVEMQLVDLRHRADVAGHAALVTSACSLPSRRNRCATLKGLRASPTNSWLPLRTVPWWIAEHAELADERIDGDLEHVRDDVLRRIRLHLGPLGVVTFALQERRRIAFARVRHQAADDVEQLVHARAGLRRTRNTPG